MGYYWAVVVHKVLQVLKQVRYILGSRTAREILSRKKPKKSKQKRGVGLWVLHFERQRAQTQGSFGLRCL